MHDFTVTAQSERVQAIHNPTGECIAKAVRADTNSTWFIGTMVSHPDNPIRFMVNVAEIKAAKDNGGYGISEVRQRKLVVTMVQSLADSL